MEYASSIFLREQRIPLGGQHINRALDASVPKGAQIGAEKTGPKIERITHEPIGIVVKLLNDGFVLRYFM